MKALILISGSGLLGIWLRYFLSVSLDKIFLQPWTGTFLINIVGSLTAGMVFALSSEKGIISEATALILLVGFCGGFTTFSAYSLQNFQLIAQGEYKQAIVCFAISPIVGLLATYLGIAAIRQIF